MQVNELRIGNFVWENYGGICIIRGIPSDQKVSVSKSSTPIIVDFKIGELKGIPISEEWLLHLGFEKVLGAQGDWKIKIQEDSGRGNGEFWLWVDFGYDNETNEIGIQIVSPESEWLNTNAKYVHQLQNLYFAILCGELVSKPK